GVIDRIGLLKAHKATESNIRQAFRYYSNGPESPQPRAFSSANCRHDVHIDMIGVWDTVKALGIQYPILWRLAPQPTDFHDERLGQTVRAGFQALALDETRTAFSPVLWKSSEDWSGHLEQAWFRGSHADVGGHIGAFAAARPLSNIPLVWMLEHAEKCGLRLPDDWRTRFPTDPNAPAHGTYRGIAKFFLSRKRRTPLSDPSEYIHESVEEHRRHLAEHGKHRRFRLYTARQ
ncbi:MAG: phospholipase effector Tle1 domain-containing protein, partial [Paracoccaceae bacterium]